MLRKNLKYVFFIVVLLIIFLCSTKEALAAEFNIWNNNSIIGPSVLQWNGLAMSDDGQYISGTVLNGQIQVSNNGGVSFIARGSSRAWRGIAMSGSGQYQTAVVFGSTGTPGYIYRSSDFGVTWATALATNKRWLNVAMSKDGRYQTAVSYHTAVGGLNGRVVVSSDYGATWSEISALNNRTFGGIAMSYDGRYQIISDTARNVMLSNDYGTTWNTVLTTTNNYVQGLGMSADGSYMTAVEDGGNIWVSNDIGVTWSEKVLTKNWKDVRLSNDGKYQTAISISTPGYVAISNDYGATWTQVMDTFAYGWTASAMSKEGDVQVIASFGSGSQSRLYKSTANCDLVYSSDPNGYISGVSIQNVPYKGDGIAVIAVSNPGYTFLRWSDGFIQNPRIDGSVIGNINVSAQFAMTYVITYDGNGNDGGTAPIDINGPYVYDELVTVLDNIGSFVKTGYNFDNWNTAANGGGTSYAPNATFNMPASNVTLYAQWKSNPTPQPRNNTRNQETYELVDLYLEVLLNNDQLTYTKVLLYPTLIEATTDSLGVAYFVKVEPGTYSVEVVYQGVKYSKDIIVPNEKEEIHIEVAFKDSDGVVVEKTDDDVVVNTTPDTKSVAKEETICKRNQTEDILRWVFISILSLGILFVPSNAVKIASGLLALLAWFLFRGCSIDIFSLIPLTLSATVASVPMVRQKNSKKNSGAQVKPMIRD